MASDSANSSAAVSGASEAQHASVLKGVLLAGGSARRLYPLTRVTNKHLLPVGRVPMIYWPLARLIEAKVRDILVVTSRDHMGEIVNLLGSGADFGAALTYRVQDKPGGIAQALGLAEDFVATAGCAVILGDNIFSQSIERHVAAFAAAPRGARLLLKRVPDAQRFGVAELTAGGRLQRIVEKPPQPLSDLAVTGCYCYDHRVFDIIRSLKPSARGELEITDVNNQYLAWGELTWSEYEGEWSDAGTFASLLQANLLASKVELPPLLRRLLEPLP
ncbi:MAG: sugar phosphate nucleotidyltransferase [Planctomycetota bacterium]|nr:sugar phosphate nucleotidyltransferase [Planctomycetota bacterium]